MEEVRILFLSNVLQREMSLYMVNDFSDKINFSTFSSNLWYFVSKFTEYDAQKLHRVYKKACVKREEKVGEAKNAEAKLSDKEKKERKHKKHRKEKHERDQRAVPNVNENSNSSFGGGESYQPQNNNKATKQNYRGDRGHAGGNSKQGYPTAEYDRNSNDSFTPTYGQYNRAKQFTQTHTPAGGMQRMPPNEPSSYPLPHEGSNHVVYRERSRGPPGDPRADRAPGDPRDRGGGHPYNQKPYHHYDDGGRGRGTSQNPNRQSGGGWNKNR